MMDHPKIDAMEDSQGFEVVGVQESTEIAREILSQNRLILETNCMIFRQLMNPLVIIKKEN